MTVSSCMLVSDLFFVSSGWKITLCKRTGQPKIRSMNAGVSQQNDELPSAKIFYFAQLWLSCYAKLVREEVWIRVRSTRANGHSRTSKGCGIIDTGAHEH